MCINLSPSRPLERTAGPNLGRLDSRNFCGHNDLGQLTGYGTPRAPQYGMIPRSRSISASFLLRFAMPAVLGLIVSAGVAEAQRPVPVKPPSETMPVELLQQQQKLKEGQAAPQPTIQLMPVAPAPPSLNPGLTPGSTGGTGK